MSCLRLLSLAVALSYCCPASGGPPPPALTVPGADGTDGAFAPATSTTVQLREAPSGTWTDAGNGNGVYDATKWAVVFKYSSVTIAAGVTVTFENHPEKAPVVWLVQGDVTIDGCLDVSGADADNDSAFYVPAAGGPGGFRGGWSCRAGESLGGSGYGPGGGQRGLGNTDGRGGSYGTGGTASQDAVPYGNERIVPLIGGSGGGAHGGTNTPNGGHPSESWGGGGGGGAILVATEGTITINGEILSRGGTPGDKGGNGSGGAIRLVADTVAGNGNLNATGGSTTGTPGGDGRIRVEAASFTHSWGLVNPVASTFLFTLPATAQIWPASTDPTVRITSVAAATLPAVVKARVGFPGPDVLLTNATGATVLIETTNVTPTPVPPDPAPTIQLLVVSRDASPVQVLDAILVGGNSTLATWKVDNIDFPLNWSALQVKVELP